MVRKKMSVSVESVFLLLILFAGIASAYCAENMKEMYFPAVIDENSSQMIMVQVRTMEKVDSNGYQTFLSTNPFVGYDTQDSINTASAAARRILGANSSGCSMLVSFYSSNEVEYIDGPSAGAGLTVLMLAALENKTIRDDLTMTGTIEADRTIGRIGGLALKGEAAYKHGYRIFLTPALSNSEKIELLMLKNYYELKILQVENAEQAYAMATTPASQRLNENIALSPESIEEYDNASLDHWYSERMKSVTENMISNERGTEGFPLPYRANFETRALNAERAIESKQFYTAANLAFLLSIDEDVSKFSKESMVEQYIEATQCLNSFEANEKTIETFEVIGPAEARYYWSAVKLNKTVESESIFRQMTDSMDGRADGMDEGEFIAPLFAVYTGLLNSKYWCFAGKDMNDYGDLNENSNRTSVDESSLKNYTEKIIEELEDSMDEGNSDSAFHLETARAAMENGKYVAALVDAAYMQSYRDIEEMNETEFETSLDLLLEKNYTFVWPKMFRNHAKVISEEDGFSALRVALIADNIERYFGDAKSILSGTGLGYAIEPPSAELIQKSEEVLSYQIFAIVTVLAGIAFISYVLMKTGLLGDDSERPKNNGRTRRDRK